MNELNYIAFELCVAKIFEQAEYSIERGVRLHTGNGDMDIVAQKDGKTYAVEVKYAQVTEKVVDRVCYNAKMHSMIPVLVTAFKIGEKRKKHYQEIYADLIIVDIANLLFAVQYNPGLYNELTAILSYAIEDIEPIEGFIRIDNLQHENYTDKLIEEMALCEAGRPDARTYEVLCHKLLENIFSEDLALWREQQKSNKDLYRFDLLCRIKDGNQKTFWSILERYFNSKYVIFEFKNYTEPITQKEIYTTEKYLYAKALRSVGILISAHGYDENAYWAAKGCLRENGKLILLLETNDLIEMNKMKIDQEDPSNYLLGKLDDLLMDLEK